MVQNAQKQNLDSNAPVTLVTRGPVAKVRLALAMTGLFSYLYIFVRVTMYRKVYLSFLNEANEDFR